VLAVALALVAVVLLGGVVLAHPGHSPKWACAGEIGYQGDDHPSPKWDCTKLP
jgi:hypothetical protein